VVVSNPNQLRSHGSVFFLHTVNLQQINIRFIEKWIW